MQRRTVEHQAGINGGSGNAPAVHNGHLLLVRRIKGLPKAAPAAGDRVDHGGMYSTLKISVRRKADVQATLKITRNSCCRAAMDMICRDRCRRTAAAAAQECARTMPGITPICMRQSMAGQSRSGEEFHLKPHIPANNVLPFQKT